MSTLSIHDLHTYDLGMSGMREFGALIKRAREQRGLTQAELGARIGYTHSFVVRLERGQMTNPPTSQTMRDLERELHDDFADRREHGEWFRLGNPHLEFYACRVNSDVMTFGCTVDEFLDLLAANREYEMHLWRRQEMREEAKTFIRKVQVH